MDDFDLYSEVLAAFIDDLPTEATFRSGVITIRTGEAPQTRQMLIAGIQPVQSLEALIKVDDCPTVPTNGELITIAGTIFKITSVAPLLSLTDPAGYRVIISRKI